VLGAQTVTTAPASWYKGTGWSTFSESTSSASGSSEGSSATQTPPVVPPRFERLWRWRTLDPSVLADVVVPEPDPAQTPPVGVRGHRDVALSDRRLANLRVTALSDHRSIAAEPVAATRLMAAVPRLQLTSLVNAQAVLASGRDRAIVSQEVVQMLEEKAPVLQAEIEGNAESASTQTVESNDLTLTMEYCVVQLSRGAWWNDILVRMPGWYAPGMRAGDIVPSSRLRDVDVGVPIAMVVTRNVQVTGHWSESDRVAAKKHTSFGPWHIGDTSLEYDQSTATASLAIPGMQVIAVICSLLPQMPPVSDPKLAAEAA
jgi:hypothetical protein